ncbi:MAG: hypothetical protein Q8N94_08025 [Methanoregula sp.]|nr:hypothetical protein [Methanoregula sp.]
MILELIDWIILIILFICFSTVFYLTVVEKVHIKYTFLLGTVFIGVIMLWGIIRFDVSMLPLWIQAGATLMLLLVTGMSTYAAITTAEANSELVKSANRQVSLTERGLKRDSIIELARDIIQEVFTLLETETREVEDGTIIFKFLQARYKNREAILRRSTPEAIFKSKIVIPDKVMEKYIDQINNLNQKFDQYTKNMDLSLMHISAKEQTFIKDFEIFYNKLLNSNSSQIGGFEFGMTFSMAIADSQIKGNSFGFLIFDAHKKELVSKLIELGLQNEINDYKNEKDEIFKLAIEYYQVLTKLLREWKEEYNLTDDELCGKNLKRSSSHSSYPPQIFLKGYIDFMSLHHRDLLLSQLVQLVHQRVDRPIRRLNLPGQQRLLVL